MPRTYDTVKKTPFADDDLGTGIKGGTLRQQLTALWAAYAALKAAAGQGGTQPTALGIPANLRQTASTSSSVTFSWDAVANATGYRLRVNGSTLYMAGPATSYTVAGLAVDSPLSAEVQALGDGVSYSASVYSATATGRTGKLLLLLGDDDSEAAYYYLADGTWVKPSPAFTGPPTTQQFLGKIAAVCTNPGFKFINNAYPGFNLLDATTDGPAPSNPAINVVENCRQVITANKASYDIEVAACFLENSFTASTLAEVKQQFDTYNSQRLAMGAKRIYWRLGVNRTGAYSDTKDGSYWPNLVAMRQYMRQQAAASNGTIVVLDEADGPNISGQNFPQNPQYCNQNDVVNGNSMNAHFSEYAVTEQANQYLKKLGNYGYTFSGPATAVGTGGVTAPTTGQISQTTTTLVYKPQPPHPEFATVGADGVLTHKTDEGWDCGTPTNELIPQPQPGETVYIRADTIEVSDPQGVLFYLASTYTQNGLANVFGGIYADKDYCRGYGYVSPTKVDFSGEFGSPTLVNGVSTYSGLYLAVEPTRITAYYGGKRLAYWDNPPFPGLVAVQLSRRGASMRSLTLTAHTHQASTY